MIKIKTPMMIIIGVKTDEDIRPIAFDKKLKSCNLPSLTALSNLFCNIWSLPIMNVCGPLLGHQICLCNFLFSFNFRALAVEKPLLIYCKTITFQLHLYLKAH
jgi:hypothetical protein